MTSDLHEQKNVSRETDPNRVDMLDVARVAQATDAREFALPGSIKVVAPAKVNLLLNIKGKRSDGYHEVDTVLHALMLHDVLLMKEIAGTGNPVQLTSRSFEGLLPLDVEPEKNIVWKAIVRLAEALDRKLGEEETIRVHLEKHIPAQAGMGGGSSDAAAALVGAAKLWGVSPIDERLEQVAAGLGADVAFFLRGGCASYNGVGEHFVKALAPMHGFLAIVKPEGGVSTPASYAAFDADPVVIPEADVAAALAAEAGRDVPLRNNMAKASERLLPEIAEVRRWLESRPGVQAAMMSGSGAAVFAVCESFNAAANVVSQAQGKGWWARTTTFSPLRAAVTPR